MGALHHTKNMQRHEWNKHNYLCINDSLKFLFPCENQGVTMIYLAPHALHHLALGPYMVVYVRSRELEFEEPMEQAQVEEFTNLNLD
jgi:hypothetical protein